MPNLAGALSSLLMSLPLIAVPCLAVFGLPSIGPATAEADADDAIELGPSVASLQADSLGTPSEQPPRTDGFSPIVDASTATPPANAFAAEPRADRHNIDRTSDRRGASANHAVGIEDDHTAAPPATMSDLGVATGAIENPFADVQQPAVTDPDAGATAATTNDLAPAGARATWEQVIAQLKGKGVEEFYLANGESDAEFYFTCYFSTGDNTTQRFEAEGATALVAARKVLAEVEAWQSTR